MITEDVAGRDAGDAVLGWLSKVVLVLDNDLGKGYAAQNPGLVASLVRSAALHYVADRLHDVVESAGREIADVLLEKLP